MDNSSIEFNTQLELDVLLNGLTEITEGYVNQFNLPDLTDVIIPEGVKTIGRFAFSSCYTITSMTIPDSVKSIGDKAFEFCSGLTRMTFKGKTRDELRFMWGYPWGLSLEKISVQV